MTKSTCFKFVTVMLIVMAISPDQPAITAEVYHFSPAAPTRVATLSVTQAELNTVMRKSKSALAFLDQFWGEEFSKTKRPFAKPGLTFIQTGQAFYKAQNHTIYFNPGFFVERMRAAAQQTRTDGDMAFIVILAHEYGHSIQRQLGLLGKDCLRVELQADRMAGAFAKAANEKGLVERGDFDEATYTFFSGRDATDKYYACAHGSGTQRVEAFHSGLKRGVRAALQ
jgi:predicted metalloprotease